MLPPSRHSLELSERDGAVGPVGVPHDHAEVLVESHPSNRLTERSSDGFHWRHSLRASGRVVRRSEIHEARPAWRWPGAEALPPPSRPRSGAAISANQRGERDDRHAPPSDGPSPRRPRLPDLPPVEHRISICPDTWRRRRDHRDVQAVNAETRRHDEQDAREASTPASMRTAASKPGRACGQFADLEQQCREEQHDAPAPR